MLCEDVRHAAELRVSIIVLVSTDRLVEMVVSSIRVSLMNPVHVVILKEVDGVRRLPIFVGRPEGDAIASFLNGNVPPRPMTHDLLADIVSHHLGAQVTQVVITHLRQNHFYATIHLRDSEGEIELDARPSDAIALAVRVDSPIYATEEVMQAAAIIPPEVEAEREEDDLSVFDEFLNTLDLDDDEDKK